MEHEMTAMETETSSQGLDDPVIESSRNAEDLKNNGNELYRKRKYQEALEMYSEAIKLLPSCAAYYSNRSATYMMLNKYRHALEDAQQATQIDKDFTKGYHREAKCFLALGNPLAAVQSYDKALLLEPDSKSIQQERATAARVKRFEDEAKKDYQRGDFRRAVYCMNQCLSEAPNAACYKLFKAECLAFLANYAEAQEMANSVLMSDHMNADAIFVRGLCLYHEDNVEKAQQHFKQVLKLNPDHNKARETFKKSKLLIQKKEEGNAAFKSGRYEEAQALYTEALEVDPHNKLTNAKLYNNRATVNTKLNRLVEAVEDCTKAVQLDEKYIKAYARRAKTYASLEQHEEAVRDYETVYKLEPNRDNKRILQDAKLELKKSKRKDYYKILGVSKDVSDDELKKAYRKRAMLHHPDRHSHDTPEKQKEEEKIFKDVGEAYAVLSDPKKKARYDSGADLDDEGGMSGFGDMDANNIFQMFFGGGASDFNFTGGGYDAHHGGRSHRGGGGFPGGFHFQF